MQDVLTEACGMASRFHSLIGRIGAYALQSQYDPKETTRAARTAFLERFLDEVDPERTLPDGERDRRAAAARKAYFARLALKSAQARRRRSQRGNRGAK